MEYYYQNQLGLLAILPRPELPSAVELQVAGVCCGLFISAKAAASAVASRTTGLAGLDALPKEALPDKLKDWKQSQPLHFATGNSGNGSLPEHAVPAEAEDLHAEAELTF